MLRSEGRVRARGRGRRGTRYGGVAPGAAQRVGGAPWGRRRGGATVLETGIVVLETGIVWRMPACVGERRIEAWW